MSAMVTQISMVCQTCACVGFVLPLHVILFTRFRMYSLEQEADTDICPNMNRLAEEHERAFQRRFDINGMAEECS